MGVLRISLARPENDEALRALAADSPMPGSVGVSYNREPSFFDALCVHGFENQVVIAEDLEAGSVVGMGMRSVRRAYLNGEPSTIGYLSGLRLRREYRNARSLSKGYRFFKDLHGDGLARLYTTTILESNEPAARLLTSGRLGLPEYEERGRYVCAALRSSRSRGVAGPPGNLVVRSAGPRDVSGILELWKQQGGRRQFFPLHDREDLETGSGALRGLPLNDISLAMRGDRIVGTAAAWDQSAYRQSVVHAYSGILRVSRPLYNLWARVSGGPRLPRAGERLPYRVLSLVAVEGEDTAVLDKLVDHLLEHRVEPGAFLMAGMHDQDPLLPVLGRWSAMDYGARLYVVHWDEDREVFDALDDRVPYLEMGAL